ncbi:MAG TPA: DUF3830 family protein [Candidatus Acidoferrales bacterium]|nr:DUF3830 family protein [Candidatus Acidoferrales bacterium]
MTTRLKLELGKVVGTIELAELDAPLSSELLLNSVLPIEQKARHSMESGREVFALLEPNLDIPDENQTIYQTVGDVLMYYKPSWFIEPEPGYLNELPVLSWIYEQDSAIMGAYAPLPTNVVGTIVEGLDALRVEAPRMRREGFGTMRVTRL